MSLSKHSRTFTNSEAVKILSHTLDELRRLPGEHSVSSELGGLRQLYGALCPLYSKSTHSSSANRRKIEKVTNSNSLEKVSKHFDRWTADPLGFWEKPIDKSKRYSDKAINEQDRARLFLISAYELDGTIEEQRILQRFVPLAAFRLFRRLVPNITSRISSQHVEKFLDAVGIQPTETAIQTYGSIIRRGCRTQAICHKAKNMDRTKNVDDSDLDAGQYWILFLDDIPDSWYVCF
ncbi:hypothetical protein QQS21_012453 [Conoideocrella luteorostrata]|uniref:Uncharacterized protein n=1 Tax=Conoideocrella luteorostrata TaxID=1105319 RepID=A0AAJ0CBH7_9HYPO|nr:hypothetical protein QQS21_012453 [Conoideocrella luteorostrata]